MEQVTYSKLNLKKGHGHPPKTCSAEKDVPGVVYADIRTAASQSHLPAEDPVPDVPGVVYADIRTAVSQNHLPAEDPVPEVQKKTLKRCDYKTLIIVLLIVLLCCAVGFIVCEHLLYTCTKDENKLKELCINNTNSSSGCLLCPRDWRLHEDLCYYYSDVTERTWSQSQDDCKKMGADLLVIKNNEQQEIIQRSIIQWGENTYWIGLHYDGDVWRWVDGEHYSGSLIQIKIRTSGRCVSMTRSGYYQDNCNAGRRWICVKKAVRI
ncbi:killer cell lectin-like receptor subfamily B member 1 [Ranitomeya variabilis]|uniref:killer cell lectin-like receptor subfamily B member 1 n=1 Tax=Ranitomeya variabilis TaxID=490064 RepID=UPI004057BBF5